MYKCEVDMEKEKFLLGVIEEFVVEVMVDHNWDVVMTGYKKYHWVNNVEGGRFQ